MKNNNNLSDIAVLVLAAGQSTRFVSAKPFAVFKEPKNQKETTLIQHIVTNIKSAGLSNIFIICLPELKEKMQNLLNETTVISSPESYKGLGNSIAYSTRQITSDREYSYLLLVLGDQIALTTDDYEKLLITRNNQSSFKCFCAEFMDCDLSKKVLSPPALLHREHFPVLKKLNGDCGAKSLIRNLKQENKVISVPIQNAQIDIDTQDELNTYLKKIS